MGISGDPLEYVYPLLPDGFALASCFVDPALLEQVEAAADEALADSSWVDVHPLLPAALTAQDAALLLAECPTVEALSAPPPPAPAMLTVSLLAPPPSLRLHSCEMRLAAQSCHMRHHWALFLVLPKTETP